MCASAGFFDECKGCSAIAAKRTAACLGPAEGSRRFTGTSGACRCSSGVDCEACTVTESLPNFGALRVDMAERWLLRALLMSMLPS